MKMVRKIKLPSNFTKLFIISGVIFFVLLIIVYGLVPDSQKSTNEVYRNDSKVPVQLLKLERDIHGQITSTVIPNTEFYVFKVDNPDVQIGEKLVTNQDGEITLSLAPGEYFFLETRPANNYTFDTDSDGNRITHYPFTVTADANDTIQVIAYNQRLSSKLVIEKTVDNVNQSDLTQEQIDTEFEFIVNFVDDGTKIYEYTIDDTTFPISSGESLYLKHGQQAIFPNLPRGIDFVVEEVPVLGYLTQSNNHQGTIINEEVTASFVNTFNSTVGSLTITKEVTGDSIDPNREYTFHAVINEKEYTFDLKDGESKVFENIPIGSSYTVEEEDYSNEGYISIPTNYTGTMIEGNIILPFINHLDDNTNAPGSLEITKEIDDDTEEIDMNKEFIFTVTFSGLTDQPTSIIVDGEPVEISNSNNEVQVLLKHGDGIVIENIPSGVRFRVQETEDIEYISTILEVEGIIASNQRIVLPFINQKINTPLGSLSISKQIDGAVTDSEIEFDFVLQIEGQPAISFTLKGGETKTFTNIPLYTNYSVREVNIPDDYALVSVENGFGTLIAEAPVVTFTNRNLTPVMTEITGTKTWETKGYDPTLPDAITLYVKNGTIVVDTIIVTPDENGNWTYAISVPKYDADGNEISYTLEEKEIEEWQSNVNGNDITNVYIAPISTNSIQVRKEITGDVPKENATFEFKMVGQNRAPMPEGTESTNNSKIISIVGEGTASFGNITFTRAGNYMYTITELHTGEDGYSYDTATYTLSIEVQKIQGELVIVARTLTKNQSIVDEALFINEYNSQVANEKVTISGVKTWDHGGLASQYRPESITVIVRNGARVVLQQEVTKSDQWSWTFVLNKYDANGDVINYTIDELPVAGYEKEISGFNIHNTYNPNYGNNINDESNNGPVDNSSQSGTNTSTGDERRILIWCILLLINASIVVYTVVQYKKSKKENSNEK